MTDNPDNKDALGGFRLVSQGKIDEEFLPFAQLIVEPIILKPSGVCCHVNSYVNCRPQLRIVVPSLSSIQRCLL
jgi:hypothetical protein